MAGNGSHVVLRAGLLYFRTDLETARRQIVDWRESLRTLEGQFNGKGAQFRGLHHLFVEVGDHERERASGPVWFQRHLPDGPLAEAEHPWQVVSFSQLPAVQPSFREYRPTDAQDDRIIRDRNRQPRAVLEPLRLRFSYLAGDHRGVQAFNSLATAAARILTTADDLADHPYAALLSDLFRPPVGCVRYIFGTVSDPPPTFVADGWQPGVRAYPDGVLIDMPLAEEVSGAGHWLLLLHRLGWRRPSGLPIRSERRAWHENASVPYEWVLQPDESAPTPDVLRDQMSRMSRTAYYSALGDESNPLDVFLASSFAIQLLLAPKAEGMARRPARPAVGKADRVQKPMPAIVTTGHAETREKVAPRLVILTATPTERDTVLRHMTPAHPKRSVLQVFHDRNTYFVGRLGLQPVALCMCGDMGSLGRDAVPSVASEAIRDWTPVAAIMVGFAFGKDAGRQCIGDVLVADRIIEYESVRVGATADIPRGHHSPAGPTVLNRFRNAPGWSFTDECEQPEVHFGPVLSGQKLIDNPEFKAELFGRYPHAIGGEMEGVGLAAAADRVKCEWLLVKGICDWADGNKGNPNKERDQLFAATAAVRFTQHVLNQPGVL